MSKIKILHSADLHLDSPFEGLPAGKAAIRRGEQRALLGALAELAGREQVGLVLLAGDLLDSGNTFFETGEELVRALSNIPAPVFISPGNHDFYSPKSPYARLKMPENVHIFTNPDIECVELPGLGARVYGAGFTESRSGPLLAGFHAQRAEGVLNVMCIHGDVGVKTSAYDPIGEDELAASGMDYVALWHVHAASGLKKAGDTWYSWPGCPEGRGFDETGEKTVGLVELGDGACELRTACIASRRYELLRVDVTGSDPLLAVHTMLPDDTVKDIYRIILTGERTEDFSLTALQSRLEDRFFQLELRDETRAPEDLWARCGEDSLRGLFLQEMHRQLESAAPEDRAAIEQAVRFGLAAMDHRDL